MQKKFKYIFLTFVVMVIFIPNVYACIGSDGCTNCGSSSAEIACKKSSAYKQYQNLQNSGSSTQNSVTTVCSGNSGCKGCKDTERSACESSAPYKAYANCNSTNCAHIGSSRDYDTCMNNCMSQKGYSYSNSVTISGGASSIGGNNGGVANPNETVINKTNGTITMKDEGTTKGELECGIFSEDTATGKYLHDIYNIIKFAVPIILLALSIVDFAKAIINDNSDELKKATTMFSKRLIVAIIILIVPTILNFVLDLFGIENCFKF